MDLAVDLVAPGNRLAIQVVQRGVADAHHEVLSDILNRPLYLAFGLAPVRSAENGLEAVEAREILKLPVARMGEASEDERQRLRAQEIERLVGNLNGPRLGAPGGRAHRAEAERTNLAFKCCCYCDGGIEKTD